MDREGRVDRNGPENKGNRDRGREAGKEEAREGGREEERTSYETRHSHRSVQPNFKTVQVGSKIQSTFRFSQNVRMYLMLTTGMIIRWYTDGRKADGGWREEG